MSLSPFRIQKSTRKGKLRERELDHQTHPNLNTFTHVRKRVAALQAGMGKLCKSLPIKYSHLPIVIITQDEHPQKKI